MPILFTDLMRDDAFEIRNRKTLRELYEVVKEAVKAKHLNLEGHTLPRALTPGWRNSSQIRSSRPEIPMSWTFL